MQKPSEDKEQKTDWIPSFQQGWECGLLLALYQISCRQPSYAQEYSSSPMPYPSCREHNISLQPFLTHRGYKLHSHSPKPLSQEQEGFLSLSPRKAIFSFQLVLVSFSHQKGICWGEEGEGDIVSKVSSIFCDLKSLLSGKVFKNQKATTPMGEIFAS